MYYCKISLKSPCTVSTALLALIEMQGLLGHISQYSSECKDGTVPGSTQGPEIILRSGFTQNRRAEMRFYTKRGNIGTVGP